jgi:hypothetical protein
LRKNYLFLAICGEQTMLTRKDHMEERETAGISLRTLLHTVGRPLVELVSGDLKRQVENVSRGSLDKVLEDTVDPTGEVGKSIRDLKTGLNDDPLKDDPGKPAASAKPAKIARPDPDEEDASPLARKYKSIGQVFDPTAKASPSAEPTPPAGSSDKASS